MKLKEYLRERRIIYRTFAEDLGIAEQTLRSIMAGIRRPGIMLALKIEKLTDGQITPAQLIEDFENAKKEKAAKKA